MGFTLGVEGKDAEAEPLLREGLEIVRGALGDGDPQVGLCLSRLGYVLRHLGKTAEAESVLRKAVGIQKNMPSGWQQAGPSAVEVELGWTLRYLSEVLEQQEKLPEAETKLREALASVSKVLYKGHGDRSSMLLALANFHARHGQLDQAETEYRELLALRQKIESLESSAKADWLDGLAKVLIREGNPAEAEGRIRQELAMKRESPGNENLDVADLSAVLGRILESRQNWSQAEAVYRERLALSEQDEEKRDLLLALRDLFRVLKAQVKLEEGEIVARKVLEVTRSIFGDESPEVAFWLNELAVVVMDIGRPKEAEPLLRNALAINKLLGKETRDEAIVLVNLATVLLQEGKLPEAEDLNRQGLAILRNVLGDDHPDVAVASAKLAATLLPEKKTDEARPLAEEAVSLFRKHPDWDAVPANYVADAFATLEQVLVNLNDTPALEEFARDSVPYLRDRLPPQDPIFAGLLAVAALGLIHGSNYLAAEPLARECLAIRAKKEPDDWRTFNARSMLGACLLGEMHYADAEPLLLAGYEGMMARLDQIPPIGRPRVTEALQCLAQLCEFTDRPGHAAEWKQKLADLESADLLRERAFSLARRGQWKEAAADLARVREVHPDDHQIWHELASLRIASAQLDLYRDQCRLSLERFGNTTNPVIAERIAKDCLILPGSGADLDIVAKMADTAVAATNHRDIRWFQLVKGLAEYRRGHFAKAVEWMDKALTDEGNERERDVQACMVLAMAYDRLKQTEEARTAFAKGTEIEQTKLPKLESGDIGAGWLDWIIAHALMREAKTLIEGTPETRTETK